MKRRLCAAIGAIIIVTTAGLAKFAYDSSTPIDRLITNTTAYIKEHPRDAMGPYTLARIHYLALATRAAAFNEESDGPLPTINEMFGRKAGDGRFTPSRSASTEAQLREHLNVSVINYRKALDMDNTNALFHLGLACVSEAALSAGFKLGAIPGDTSTAGKADDFAPVWREQAIAEYLRAYELSIQGDSAIRSAPWTGLNSLVSYEAGENYVAMVAARGVRGSERQTVDKVQKSLQTLGSKPGGGVTPIIFRLSGPAPLGDLLDVRKTVAFDLDGTRRPQRYTWLRPDTGVLIWDPANTGTITSGHQLFGSVTFQMFWSDGYRALDALDDNRDRRLSGNELSGLAVWFDRNQNGVSEQGEIVPIAHTGIAAIATQPTSAVGASLANEAGLKTTDGRILPTYDWTTNPLEDAPAFSLAAPRSGEQSPGRHTGDAERGVSQ